MDSCDDAYLIGNFIKGILQRIAENGAIQESISDARQSIAQEIDSALSRDIIPCMECAPCLDYSFYVNAFQKVLDQGVVRDQLRQELHMWEKTQIRDDVFNSILASAVNSEDFNKSPISVIGKTAYIDQNVLSLYAQDEGVKRRVDAIKELAGIVFYYSPSNLEEIYKIRDQEERAKLVSAMSGLTDDTVVLPDGDKNTFFKERPIYGLNRIEKFGECTIHLESLKVVAAKDREIYLDRYDAKEHKKRIANNDAIFESLDEESFRELVGLSHSSSFEKSDYKGITSRITVLHAIYTLSNMLDLIGYKVETKARTQKSSLHDIEHLIYGVEADYFVTNDQKLWHRAKQIYKFMGRQVGVVSLEEFLALNNE